MLVTPSQSDQLATGLRPWQLGVDITFAASTVLLLYATLVLRGYETVPYHLVFVSFAAVYGFRVWSLGVTIAVLGAIVAATGAIFLIHWQEGRMPADELFEIGLMPLILGAMVWHARRRVAAQRQVEQMVARERDRRLLDRELARDTSHALRTPLTIARGHVELIRDSVTDELQVHDANVALEELDRIGRMASRLIAIAELERPDALTPHRVDLAGLVHDVHDRWMTSVPRIWSLDAPDRLPALVDDEVIRTALDAMVENAVAVTSEDDEIRLVCRVMESDVLLAVSDSGPGIEAKDMGHVFRRFWRSSSKREGTGLGLSYVLAAAQAHGGSPQVHRSVLGGAVVGLLLPQTVLLADLPERIDAHQDLTPA